MNRRICELYPHKTVKMCGILPHLQNHSSIYLTNFVHCSILSASMVTGSCRNLINICWMSERINLDTFLQSQIAFLLITKVMLIYKTNAPLGGHKTIAVPLLSLLSQEKTEWSETHLILWKTGWQLSTGAQASSVAPGEWLVGMVGRACSYRT